METRKIDGSGVPGRALEAQETARAEAPRAGQTWFVGGTRRGCSRSGERWQEQRVVVWQRLGNEEPLRLW